VPGEIARMRDIIEPTIAVITNIGYAHVEGSGRWKVCWPRSCRCWMARPWLSLARDGRDVARSTPPDAGDPCRPSREEQRRRVARPPPRHGWPSALALDSGEKFTLPALGIHQLENAQIALAVAQRAAWITTPPCGPWRASTSQRGVGNVREIGNMVVIDDTYNANPASMRRRVQTADWLARRQRRPFVVV